MISRGFQQTLIFLLTPPQTLYDRKGKTDARGHSKHTVHFWVVHGGDMEQCLQMSHGEVKGFKISQKSVTYSDSTVEHRVLDTRTFDAIFEYSICRVSDPSIRVLNFHSI